MLLELETYKNNRPNENDAVGILEDKIKQEIKLRKDLK